MTGVVAPRMVPCIVALIWVAEITTPRGNDAIDVPETMTPSPMPRRSIPVEVNSVLVDVIVQLEILASSKPLTFVPVSTTIPYCGIPAKATVLIAQLAMIGEGEVSVKLSCSALNRHVECDTTASLKANQG